MLGLKQNKCVGLSLFVSSELETFKGRRVVAFRKNMVALAELQIKHARVRTPDRHTADVQQTDVMLLCSVPCDAHSLKYTCSSHTVVVSWYVY